MSDNNKPIQSSNWGWFSVFDPTNNTEPEPITNRTTDELSQITGASLTGTEAEFEVLEQDNMSIKSFTASINGDMINDQYVNLNQYGSATPIKHSDDDKKENNQTSETSNDAVVVSQALTSNNSVESLCQTIANQHIIDVKCLFVYALPLSAN